MATPAQTSNKIRTTFRKQKVIAPLHTAGPFAVSSDGSKIATCVGEEIILTDVGSSSEVCRFKGDTTPVTAIAITPSGKHLLAFYTSLMLRTYEIPSTKSSETSGPMPWIRQTSRAHDAPIHVACIDESSSLLASGSADGVVKIWDIQRGYVTHAFRGHGGIVSALAFHTQQSDSGGRTIYLVTASMDTQIRVFDLAAAASRAAGAKAIVTLEGHVSVPRGLSVSTDGRWLVSGGRDSVVLIWDFQRAIVSASGSSKNKVSVSQSALVKTIPVSERVEAVSIIAVVEDATDNPAKEKPPLRFFTAGERGVVRIWDGWKEKVIGSLHGQGLAPSGAEDDQEQRQIVNAFYIPTSESIVAMHADQNILVHSLRDSSLLRQLIGFNDEIVDATFLSPFSDSSSPDSHVALATNSSLIRIYTTSNLDARLVSGHSDTVLCLDKDPQANILASGSKDKSARLWRLAGDGTWGCIAICEGHAESIGAVALSRTTRKDGGVLRFMFTGSQDRTVKMWDLSSISLGDLVVSDPARPKSLTTHIAHDKDINSLDVSPNDRLLATASQDKTAKIFEITYITGSSGVRGEVKHVGTLKGHKRGVWSIKFSRNDRVIATASGDKSIKLWGLDDYSCLKTFEGHTNSVLRVEFLNRGKQLVSAASDGLVKLWNIQEEECITSLDNHEDKVWALAISTNEKTILSGAADSMVTFWNDCTEEDELERETQRADIALKEQDFLNYINLQDYQNAILLALSMDQPGRLFNLFRSVRASRTLSESTSITGNISVDQVIKTLAPFELARLLRHVRNWNASSKSHAVAQTVLHAVLKLRSASDIIKAFNGDHATLAGITGSKSDVLPRDAPKDEELRALNGLVDELIPYTERHFARAEGMVQDSFIVDYILSEMDSGLGFGNGDAMEVDGV